MLLQLFSHLLSLFPHANIFCIILHFFDVQILDIDDSEIFPGLIGESIICNVHQASSGRTEASFILHRKRGTKRDVVFKVLLNHAYIRTFNYYHTLSTHANLGKFSRGKISMESNPHTIDCI
jgi:hypothetical protein